MNDEKKAVYVKEPDDKSFLLKKALLLRAAEAADSRLPEDSLTEDEKVCIADIAKKRGAADSAFKIIERDEIVYAFTDMVAAVQKALNAAGITGDETGQLTSESLKTGAWKTQTFRSYNIQLPPARVIPGRTNPYVDFLEGVKDKLTSLGFEEFDGPLVETDFWNSDALFMPQFHAARDIHDVYYLKHPTHAKSIEEPFLSRVAEIHETGGDSGSRGWNYHFDRDFTRQLLLRSQGTVLSAHQLAKAKIPGKYFGIARCFRYDKVDATHLSDFYQTEGIVLGEQVNLRTLLGILKMFAVEIAGATEVKYVGGYFPFTEPSIEVHIKHPVLGWFELGGSGIFRPEVTKAMGIDVPVLAWGIGIDRMALMALGLNDLRELFSTDIEGVRLRR
ncbi:phenylalanine--tRNA ligase, alpha subunit [Treponema vincentii ATCC 35580]|nr:phenylalanine--tRNA ligase, alpha subunit [Treponema vincentii ATCC 35580]